MRRRLRRPAPAADPARNVTYGELEVDKWAVSSFVCERLVPIVGTHPFPLDELVLLVAATCAFKPAQIFEWGTHFGVSARVFAETCDAFGLDAEVHSTDLPDEAEHGEHVGAEIGRLVRGNPRVTLHRGDGLTVSLELWESSGRPPALLLLDGDHAYESVKRELEAIAAAAPEAGILVHDTFFQSEEAGYNVGPHLAIGELVASRPGRYRRVEMALGLPGMTFLYPHRG